ncbi:hypothetical protein GF337_06280 [candidate division KSB1 bacterium]|nr:hypothetical protein [candidate division KSB1 bacterium]
MDNINREQVKPKRKLYIPRMSYSASRAMAAAFKSIGIDAYPSPQSDARTLELGAKYLSGDECLPEKVTLGNFLKIVEDDNFDPEHTAFLMPTAGGPCRFGQYKPLFAKILRDKGYPNARIVSPTSSDGYEGFGENVQELLRTGWDAVIASDILRKLHLQIRPYAHEREQANALFQDSLNEVCEAIAEPGISSKIKLQNIRTALERARAKYLKLPADFAQQKPLIGIVGEIYCRLNEFSNDYLVNKIEEHGGEVWMTDIAEWTWYTNDEQRLRLIRAGKRFSLDMLKAKIKWYIQHKDEHFLMHPFIGEFEGYEEPSDVREVLGYSRPYLPQEGALGEMVLNVGKSIYLQKKGADGIIDISPFSCMNGIVCEVVYPQVSRDYDNFPIRIFYFDGTQTDLDRDVGIFMEMVRTYQKRKKHQRVVPHYFHK